MPAREWPAAAPRRRPRRPTAPRRAPAPAPSMGLRDDDANADARPRRPPKHRRLHPRPRMSPAAARSPRHRPSRRRRQGESRRREGRKIAEPMLRPRRRPSRPGAPRGRARRQGRRPPPCKGARARGRCTAPPPPPRPLVAKGARASGSTTRARRSTRARQPGHRQRTRGVHVRRERQERRSGSAFWRPRTSAPPMLPAARRGRGSRRRQDVLRTGRKGRPAQRSQVDVSGATPGAPRAPDRVVHPRRQRKYNAKRHDAHGAGGLISERAARPRHNSEAPSLQFFIGSPHRSLDSWRRPPR